MKFVLALTFVTLFLWPEGVHADPATCVSTFYQTRDRACIDSLVQETSKPGPGTDHPSINPGIVGFFAALFQTDASERARLLAVDVPLPTKAVFAEALYLAGVGDTAQTYVTREGLTNLLQHLKDHGVTELNELRPSDVPADNDVLIGAYSESGNIHYLEPILFNFSSADDDMVKDSLRLSLLQGKFGPSLAPANRPKGLPLQTACEKYSCKQDMHKLMRVMTLSSAFWALRSISRQDEAVKTTFDGFFRKDPRLTRILDEESNAFGNYLTTLAAYSVVTDNPGINASLSIYEKLGSGQDAASALMEKKQ